jgi:putative oxidoreductase
MPNGWPLALARLLFFQLFFISAWNKAFVDPFARLAGRLGQKGFPFPEIVAAGDIAFEFAIAFMMLVGWKTRWAAWGMLGFCVVAGVLFHDFWNVPQAQMYGQTTQLLKNLSTVGGLIYVIVYGPGPLSVDERARSAPAAATPSATADA